MPFVAFAPKVAQRTLQATALRARLRRRSTYALRPIGRSRCARASWCVCAVVCAFFEPASRISQTFADGPRILCGVPESGSIQVTRLSAISFLQSTQPIAAVRQSRSIRATVSAAKTVCATRTRDRSPGRPGSVRRCALRVRHHVADFRADFVGRIAEPDGVAVGLRHAAAVEAGQARRFGQQMGWLGEAWFLKYLVSGTISRRISHRRSQARLANHVYHAFSQWGSLGPSRFPPTPGRIRSRDRYLLLHVRTPPREQLVVDLQAESEC